MRKLLLWLLAFQERRVTKRLRRLQLWRQSAAERLLQSQLAEIQTAKDEQAAAARATESALREQIATIQAELRVLRKENTLLQAAYERSQKTLDADVAAECRREAIGEPRKPK